MLVGTPAPVNPPLAPSPDPAATHSPDQETTVDGEERARPFAFCARREPHAPHDSQNELDGSVGHDRIRGLDHLLLRRQVRAPEIHRATSTSHRIAHSAQSCRVALPDYRGASTRSLYRITQWPGRAPSKRPCGARLLARSRISPPRCGSHPPGHGARERLDERTTVRVHQLHLHALHEDAPGNRDHEREGEADHPLHQRQRPLDLGYRLFEVALGSELLDQLATERVGHLLRLVVWHPAALSRRA